jgi:uncharacterized protein with FMN-binding domain
MIKLFSIFLMGAILFASISMTSCGRLSNSIWTPRGVAVAAGATIIIGDAGNLGPFTPGTFEGTGPVGHYDVVRVAVTFDETRMIALEVTYSIETPVFAAPAFGTLIPRVLLAQTYAVDTFSGATETSVAFLGAVQDAVQQAR